MDVCDEYQKETKLARLLEEIGCEPHNKILIFVETKRKADELTRLMRRDGYPAMCIHGDKQQKERDWVLGEFKHVSTTILVATDVAARGLDVDDIKFVINYDYPNNSEDYVHRIGRTGRRDRTGTAYTLFTPSNAPKANDLIEVLTEAKQVKRLSSTKFMLQLSSGGILIFSCSLFRSSTLSFKSWRSAHAMGAAVAGALAVVASAAAGDALAAVAADVQGEAASGEKEEHLDPIFFMSAVPSFSFCDVSCSFGSTKKLAPSALMLHTHYPSHLPPYEKY